MVTHSIPMPSLSFLFRFSRQMGEEGSSELYIYTAWLSSSDCYCFYTCMHVGCFYFTLGNLHPKYRSTLKSIQLLALIKNEHLKQYGMDSVLRYITADVAKLEKVWLYMYIYSFSFKFGIVIMCSIYT